MKRRYWDIVYYKREGVWRSISGHVNCEFDTQAEAITATIGMCLSHFDATGEPSEVRIKNRQGQIRDCRTYPRSSDPKGSKG